MTTMLRRITLANAAWREAVRIRRPEVDLDHLLLALIASGGPAAALLGRHGVTLAGARQAAAQAHTSVLTDLDPALVADVEPLPMRDLHVGAAGHAPMAPRADAVLDRLPRSWSETDLLRALLAEPSGLAADVLRRCGVDPDAVAEQAQATPRTQAHEPRRCAPPDDLAPPVPGTRTGAVAMTHMISAPVDVVRRVAADPHTALLWLPVDPETTTVEDDDTLRATRETRRGTHVTTFTRAVDAPVRDGVRVAWCQTFHAPGTRWDGAPGGFEDLHLRAVPGGTAVEYTTGIRTFGRLAAPALWIAHVTGPMAMPHRMFALALAVADAG